MATEALASVSIIMTKRNTRTNRPTGGGSCLSIDFFSSRTKVTMKNAQARAEIKKNIKSRNFIAKPPFLNVLADENDKPPMNKA